MELGALVCTPKTPDCKKCSLQNLCLAYRENQQKLNESKEANDVNTSTCTICTTTSYLPITRYLDLLLL